MDQLLKLAGISSAFGRLFTVRNPGVLDEIREVDTEPHAREEAISRRPVQEGLEASSSQALTLAERGLILRHEYGLRYLVPNLLGIALGREAACNISL
jgi:hypothetical protein